MGKLEYLGKLRGLLKIFCFSGKRNTVVAYYETFNVKLGNFLCDKLKNRPEFGIRPPSP
jgi:hypothetical protein